MAADLRDDEADAAAARLEGFRRRHLDLAERTGNPRLRHTAERLRALEAEVAAAARGEWSETDRARHAKRFIALGRLTKGR